VETNKSVLVIGLVPELVDFSAFPGMNAGTVRAGIDGQVARLRELGYAAQSCWVDLGDTVESVLGERLAAEAFACVVIGAGLRVPPAHLMLFEKLINLVHAGAPGAKICFNTKPTDTVEAVRRWL
jgi:hypothetical protein